MKYVIATSLLALSVSAFANGSGQQASTDMQDKDCAGVANSGDRQPVVKDQAPAGTATSKGSQETTTR